jgi:tetratricopeptide (TPR) repeat protein
MKSWTDYKDDWLLLLEAGFIAVNLADEDSALKLFKAAEMFKPDHPLPKVGFGYLHLHKLELKQAGKMFEDALALDPKNEMAKALLGLSMSLAPTTLEKGEKILEETLKSHDPMIKTLSDSAIDFIERFLKKAPSPIEGTKRKSS